MSVNLNFESIILLLLFIAPGFLFTRTYTAYRPRYYRPPDGFEQTVLSIIGSAIIHTTLLAGLAIGLLVYWLAGGPLIYYFSLLGQMPLSPTTYPPPVLIASIFMGIFYLALSLVLARRFATFIGYRTVANRPRWWTLILGQDPPEPFLLWHSILQVEPLELNLIPPRLNIQMRSGEFFEGDLYSLRMVGDEVNTVELALRKAAYRRPFSPTDKQSPNLQPLPNQVILLKSTDILWLTRNDIPR
jgi:hypothetical protein